MFRKKDYWLPNSPLLINSKNFQNLLTNNPYIVVDGGAAGDVGPPFKSVHKHCQFVRFEPRGEDVVELNNDVYVDGGLWESDCAKNLHVANNPNTSSIYPPNNSLLKQFDDRYGFNARKTVDTIKIKLRSINSAVKNEEMPMPNFIKLDIHSAEFEAIRGSIESLSENLGFLVETWHTDVHQGQHLHGELESLLVEMGYEVFDTRMAAAWHYKFEEKIADHDKPRYIGSEMLFLRKKIPKHLELKYIGLCDLFNFSNLTKTLILKSESECINELFEPYCKIVSQQKTNWRWKRAGIKIELKNFLRKLLGRYNP